MSDQERYKRLRDACLDGSATEAEMKQFSELLSTSEEFLDDYLEHAQQDATLQWYGFSKHLVQSDDPIESPRIWRGNRLAIALAASLLLILTTAWVYRSTSSPVAVARIESASNCKWGMSTVPTSFDSDLPAGRLRLISGVAKLKFPNVSVTLEGPVDMEILSRDRCRLHSGRVVGWVEPGGEGFVVETPCAEIVDRGTKFGVTVSDSGNAQLDVIDGKVDIRHLSTGRTITARGASSIQATQQEIEVVGNKVRPNQTPEASASPRRVSYISTSDGVGDEAYITQGEQLEGNDFPRPDNTLLVKHADGEPHWERKTILRFDLSKLDDAEILHAHLRLDGVATGMGYASLVPDATFAIYGLLEEYETNWDSDTLSWELFDGVYKDSDELDDEKVVLLGHLLIPQSQPEGRFILDDPRLARFLVQDSDSTVTLIVERITSGTAGPSYVHGFASRTHPTASPPTLRVETNRTAN
ncbi:FecR protein [Stieleria maiorica]|uniref:FecR protein n=1 Tax=Stieleria maiorica TaxID=2795974 RepID=A0A5B9MND3_9BACT|nr:FecR domain-containing protein [Stieleria maiorica]QEG01437.1 FecR protein [Stieleria maiorica]